MPPLDMPLYALTLAAFLFCSYAIGSIPSAYLVVRRVAGKDITRHGSGNVGAMNVHHTTGSWGWFAVTVIADMAKGFIPVAIAKHVAGIAILTPVSISMIARGWRPALFPMVAMAGAVLGHNYSFVMALIKKRFARSGMGLAAGAGALLVYDMRYLVAVLIGACATLLLTRYLMAAQVAAAITLPVAAALLRSPDFPFALAMGVIVYSAHHRRFIGLLHGNEPRLTIPRKQGRES